MQPRQCRLKSVLSAVTSVCTLTHFSQGIDTQHSSVTDLVCQKQQLWAAPHFSSA